MTFRFFIIAISVFVTTSAARGDGREQAKVLYKTLTGVPLALGDVRLSRMAELIDAGRIDEAAAIATDDDNFYDVTLRHFGSHLFNRDEFQSVELDDATAMIIGHTAANADTRELLYGDFWYLGTGVAGLPAYDVTTNAHFQFLESRRVALRRTLVRVSPQRASIPGAGVFTTRAWAKHHLSAGTNRRAVEFAFREFLCMGIRDIADTNAPSDRVRRDVDRRPGGNPMVFTTRCVGCHGPMDALAGAFARYTFTFTDAMAKVNGNLEFSAGVQGKMNQNPLYDAGYVTTDDSWINYAAFGHNERLGWRGASEGNGPAEFGQLIANSGEFSRCMAKRVFSQLCINTDFVVDRITDVHRKQLEAAESQIRELATDFEATGYRLRRLFEKTATMPKCLNR